MYKVPFLESCLGCEGFCEVETKSEYLVVDADHANVGDVVSCSQCGCVGVIEMDDEGKYYHLEKGFCDECMARFEEMLEGLVEKISQRIKAS